MKLFTITLYTIIIVFYSMQGLAQMDIDWFHNIRAGQYSHIMDFVETDGNIYIAYCAKGKTEDDNYSSEISNEDSQTSLIKLNVQGEVIWRNSIISKEVRITNIIKTPEGKIVAMGYSSGEAKFRSINGSKLLPCKEDSFLFLAFYSEEGKLINIETIDQKKGRRKILPYSIASNSSNELFVGINYYNHLQYKGKAISVKDTVKENSAVLKFSNKGEFEKVIKKWEIIGTRTNVEVNIDSKDNIIISGYSRGIVKLSNKIVLKCSGGNVYAANTSFSFVAKYTPDYQLLWHQKIGGRNNQRITGIELNSKNDVYVYGTYTMECIFSNTSSINNTSYERRFEGSIFYAKIASDGSLSFVKYNRSNGGNSCRSGSISIDENDIVHLTGYYNDIIYFDSSDTLRTSSVQKSSSKLNRKWQVNTRGNSAWFYSVWKDDTNIYCQNLYELNGYPDAQYCRKLIASNGKIYSAGFYHVGKPTLMSTTEKIELGKSGDSGMYSIFISSGIPYNQFQAPTFNATNMDSLITLTRMIEDSIPTFNSFLATESIIIRDSSKTPINELLTKVNIYPNPVSHWVTIDLNHFSQWVDFTIISQTGSILFSQTITQVSELETFQLDLSSFANGVYNIVVVSPGFRKSYPIIKVS